ncbi:MAG: PilZ domain-containing protein [Candidatus Sumerlaeia bacterium]|nr:PilZ domain-containing protein [Candidatus Sumerlaeia bacterium]
MVLPPPPRDLSDTDPEYRRRRFPRFPINIEGRIRVPLAEYSGGSLNAKAVVEDISLNGARIRIPHLRREHHATLMHGRRKCAITLQFPEENVPLFLSGEIAWIDLHSDATQSSAVLGVELTDTPPPERERLGRLLENKQPKL